MDSPAREAVKRVVELLERAHEEHWAEQFRHLLWLLEAGEAKAADDAYRRLPKTGGGGLTELVLSADNGHTVEPGEQKALNIELWKRLGVVADAFGRR
jgi:hypothetical protein